MLIDNLLVYRGQHGAHATELRSFVGSLTFCDLRHVAAIYAKEPNDRTKAPVAVNPAVITAQVAINKPLFDTPDDPFVEFSLLIEKLSLEAILPFALKHSSWVIDTNAWHEDYSADFESLDQLLAHDATALSQLYMQAYPLLDDPDFVALAVKHGFDGAVHAGSGAGLESVEYRIFDAKQASILSIEPLN